MNENPSPNRGIKTKTILRYQYESVFGQGSENLTEKTVVGYDRDGRKVKVSSSEKSGFYLYSGDWERYTDTFYQYDSNKNIVEEIQKIIEIDKSDGFTKNEYEVKTIYEYDSIGNRIGKIKYEDNVLDRKTIYKYDFMGNMDEKSYYDSNGNPTEDEDGFGISKYVYEYDSNGNKIGKLEYDSNGSLETKTIYKYDSNENKVEESEYESDGSLSSKNIYEYDSNGNMVEESNYNPEGSTDGKSFYEYDSIGNKIKEIHDSLIDGMKIKMGTSHLYDRENRLIEEREFGESQELLDGKTQYEYEKY
jgi:hypothetical protein